MHTLAAAQSHAGVVAKMVKRAGDVAVADEDRRGKQQIDVALLAKTQGTVNENAATGARR